MTELSKRFGEIVAQTRKRRGISQERLGELTGLHRDTIRRVENRKGALKAGTPVRASITGRTAANAVVIPAEAIQTTPSSPDAPATGRAGS